MEHADPAIPSIVETSSSKKKKSKKEKKKRKRDESSSPSMVNGTKKNGSEKKKKKDKKKDKSNGNNAAVSKNGASEQEEQPQPQAPSDTPEQIATSSAAAGIRPILSLSAKASNKGGGDPKLKKSPYQTKTILGTVALLPSSLPDVTKCISTLLHSLLLMYDANMGGVLLSLEEDGIKLLPIDNTTKSNKQQRGLVGGRVVDDLPYIHYRFQVSGLLFCPSVGMKLRGQVVECTATYITLTTHHILSTKISTAKLHESGFFYNDTTLEWTRERETTEGDDEGDDGVLLGPSTSIYLDDVVEFVVERIHECGGYISLDGMRPSVASTLS